MKDSKKKELIQFTGLMGISGLISKFISIPRSIVFAKFLMPSGYGILQIIKVIVSYFGYIQLGVLQAMNRNVPKEIAKGNLTKVKEIKDLSFTWLSTISFLALVILWITYIIDLSFIEQLSLLNMVLLTVVIIFSQANSFFKPLLKSEGKFIIIGKILLIKSSITPFVGMFLVYLFNLSGAIIALAIDQIFMFLASLYFFKEYTPNFYFNINLFITQASKGALIFLNRFSENLISSLTILMIAYYYGTIDVGIFSFGILSLINASRYTVPIRMYFYREIMLMHESENKDNEFYKKLFKLPHLFNLILNTILLGLFSIIYFKIINLFLPKYLGSIPVIYISLFSLIIYNARVFFGQFLDATNQLFIRTIFIFIGSGLGIILSYIFLINKFPIYFLSISCGIGFIIISLQMMFFVYKQVSKSYVSTIKMVSKTLFIASINTYIIYFISDINIFKINYFEVDLINIIKSIIELMLNGSFIIIFNYLIFGVIYYREHLFHEMNKLIITFLNKFNILKLN